MSDSFDPYRVWLGIPSESRPPTHYQLLSISPEETELAVIEAAVLRQSGYVRNFQIGNYAKDAARILGEIAAAKACLLDPAKRAEYDAELKARKPAAANPGFQAVSSVPLAPTLPAIDIDLLADSVSGDLLKGSARVPAPVLGIGAARKFTLRRLRGAATPKRRQIPWQSLGGFAVGIAFAVAIVALWPKRAVEKTPERESPVVLIGTAYKQPSPVALREAQPVRESEAVGKVLQIKTLGCIWPRDVARREGESFFVGISADLGSTAIGYELQVAGRVRLSLKIIGRLRRVGDNSLAGFVVDYRTPRGYSQRVALSIGPFNDKMTWPWPQWGKRARPDRFIDLSQSFAFNERKYLDENQDIVTAVANGDFTDGQEHWQRFGRVEGRHAVFGQTDIHELNLEKWAPPDWDGHVWFSAVVVDTGAGTGIDGRLIDPAPPPTEKLPGEYRRLAGHTDSIAALAFLPDGRLLSGSYDTTWAVWETGAAMRMQRFPSPGLGHENAIRALAIRPDGQVALISSGNEIACVELSTGNVLKWLDGHRGGVRGLAFLPGGTRAVSGGWDATVRLWDVEAGKEIWAAGLRSSPAYSVALSRDGNSVVAGIYPNEGDHVRLFDTASGREVRSIKAGEKAAGAVIGISLSADAKLCLTGFEYLGFVKLLDLESGMETAKFGAAPGGGSKPVFSPDGHYAAWGGNDEVVSVWDIENRSMLAEFEHERLGSPMQRRHVHDWMPVAFSPDGKLLASGADDGTIYLWNVPESPTDDGAKAHGP